MAGELRVYRVGFADPELVGTLGPDGSFAYDPAYLCRPDAAPLSVSLPLGATPYAPGDARPYFEGLLPEGTARKAIAAERHLREDNYLAILAAYGFDCIGDVVVAEGPAPLRPRYEPIAAGSIGGLFATAPAMAQANSLSRLSLAGTQHKVGLAHMPGESLDTGWLCPRDGAASTHILKTGERENVLFLEYLCMRAAEACGVDVARTDLLDMGRPVICGERFDRRVSVERGGLRVERLHQEDLAQAFGLLPGSKYAELEPSTGERVALLLREKACNPIASIDAFVRLTYFNYLIGNCDNHLKNLSLRYAPGWAGFDLAPAYDLVCTTWFPDLSREMGMRLGSVRAIDDVTADDLVVFARSIRYPERRARAACHELASCIDDAIAGAADAAPSAFDEVAWKAEDLIGDIAPRRRVLEQV